MKILVADSRPDALALAAQADAVAGVPVRSRRRRGRRRRGPGTWDGEGSAPIGWTGRHRVRRHPTDGSWGVFIDHTVAPSFPSAVDWTFDWKVEVSDD